MKKILYIALAFAALFAVSCQKEKELHPVGSKIVFSASTEFRNGLETRTIYTGEYTQTSPNYERIQWVANDPIKILYSHGSSTSANYAIDGTTIGGTGTAKKSTASINASGTALEWEGGNSHIFYGIYPASAGTLTAGSVTGLSIPATQTVTWNADQSKYLPTMTNAFMVAYKDMSSDPTGTVNLPFTPVVNAVEFRLKLPDTNPSYTVSQVQLSHGSTAIAGSYDVSITGFANDAVTWSASSNSTTKKILVNFSPANPAVPTSTSGNVLDFTILTLPVQISNPILEIKYSDGHVLKLTLSGLTLQPGQKCIVTNSKAGHDDFTYEVSTPASQTITGHSAASFSQINVSSLKRSGANNTYTEPVAWKVQYTTDNGTTWTDGVPSTHTLTEDHTNNTFTVALNAANTSVTAYQNGNPYAAATEILRSREPLSGTNDLSLLSATGTSIQQTSANCYVVTRAGTYRIPLIYGNARVNGSNNPSAYSVSSTGISTASGNTDDTQNYFLPTFYNAKGTAITSPYILTDLGSVSGLSAEVSSLSQEPCISNPTVGGSGSSAYIQFTINQSSIKPGNNLINLKGTVGSYSNTVLWSWHIWVTDRDLSPDSNNLLPYNLGWIDANTTVNNSVRKYTDRPLQLRLVQVEGGTMVNNRVQGGTVVREGTPFTLTQTGDAESVNNPSDGDPAKGYNPHYQWGRKDPFPMSNATITLTQRGDVLSSYDYGKGIREPATMFKGEKSTTWMDGKAIPLYKTTQTPTGNYTLAAGGYGPFTDSQKSVIQGILGNSGWSTLKRVNSYGGTERWFTDQVYNWMISGPSAVIPEPVYSDNWFLQGVVYAMKEGTILSSVQLTTLSNLCTTIGIVSWPNIGINANDYAGFVNKCLDDVHYITLSTALTVTSVQKTTLEGQGFSSSVFSPETNTVETYTTNTERNAGSILHNLWSTTLINEYASLSGGKYKTVYDPCPAGYTVPTVATYLEGTQLSSLNNKAKTGISTFTGYPRTGMRINGGTGGSEGLMMTSNLTPCGFYWTDHSCNMEWNPNNPDKGSIDSYLYQHSAYMMHTMDNTCSVLPFTRGSAASIRPMVDPRAASVAGNASPASVSASNPIENVTMGPQLQ